MRNRRMTWMAGGLGLIVCGLLGIFASGAFGAPGGQIVRVAENLIYAGAVLLFAIGLSREASVVARRPLGVTALVFVALWPLAAIVWEQFLEVQEPTGGAEWTTFGYVSLAVTAGSSLVAAVQIARAGTVPPPWRWAPLWVLGLQAAVWVIPELTVAAVGADGLQGLAPVLSMLGMLAFVASTLGLGVLALVLAAQLRPETVEVFRST